MLGTKYLSRAAIALLLGLMTAPLLFAAPGADKMSWENLKLLAPSEQIRIVFSDSKQYRGEFQSASDEVVVVRLATGERTFPRADILRISAKSKGRGHRNTLIGAGIGAGLGGVAVAMDCRNDRPGCSPLGLLVGAGMGYLIGVLVPSGGWYDVYRLR